MFILSRTKNDTSVALDALRAVAAQMVCVGHGISFFASDWRPANLAFMQNVGVLLFFLISGFLITHTLIQKSNDPNYGFLQFGVDRFARIYAGLIPALVFVAIVDGVTIYLTNDPAIQRYYTWKTMIANLFMLEGYRGIFPGYLQWSAVGSASPLWTLAIEWHIYIFVGSLFFMAARPKSFPFLIPVALFFGQTPVHFLFGAFQPDGVGRSLFALWLGGALVYFLDRSPVAKFVPAATIALVGVAAFTATTLPGAEYNLISYGLLAAVFFGLVAMSQSVHLITSPAILKTIAFVADYSFSLYLVHHTIMYAIWTIFPARGPGIFAIAVIVSNLVAIGLAEIGEKHHRIVASFLHRKLPSRSKPTNIAANQG
ncbi:acyltransferase [Bradyrhizobium sp. 197]|uniref:acyltransferase family protein n=1 Tax=Bradyrhizobium sp. 197 TaxID=2782663 RepID=UPI001FFB0650|nr:acyltransferase [Bradyrhizobium sp. 197]MCK1475436.1 acyltransferase [Bradyrhizobium sp. 197]